MPMDHTAYAHAVVPALTAEGLQLAAPTSEALLVAEQPLRHCVVELAPHQPGTAFRALAAVTATWTDRAGWRLELVGTAGPHTTVYYGQQLVPAPSTIASWIAQVLTVPAVVTDHSDDPPGQVSESDLQRQLSQYRSLQQ